MSRKGYTLIEVLVIIVILGISAAVVVPHMGSTQVLQVQSAVRSVVSDITFAQSDALAYQDRRAIIFDMANNRYMLLDVNGPTLDPEVDILFDGTKADQRYEVNLNDPRFGGAAITSVDFDGDEVLIFDELGGPVQSPTGDTPGMGGVVEITGSGQTFEIRVEAYTGRVTVVRTAG